MLQQAMKARMRVCSCASPPSPPASTKAARCSEARSHRWCVLRGAAGSEAGGSREWERAKTATPPRVTQPDARRHAAHLTSSLLWFCSAAPCTFAAMSPERRARRRGSDGSAETRPAQLQRLGKRGRDTAGSRSKTRGNRREREEKKSVRCPVTQKKTLLGDSRTWRATACLTRDTVAADTEAA